MPKGYNAVMSKKRYNEIIDFLKQSIHDDAMVETIEEKIKEIFNFDPSKPAYNPEYGKKQAEKRKERALQKGASVYELYRKPYLKIYKSDQDN